MMSVRWQVSFRIQFKAVANLSKYRGQIEAHMVGLCRDNTCYSSIYPGMGIRLDTQGIGGRHCGCRPWSAEHLYQVA